jgi:hypothetical protein
MKRRLSQFMASVFLVSLLPFNIQLVHAETQTAEYKAALSQMRVTKDAVRGITWYQDKSSPRFVNSNGFFLYMGTSKGFNTTLRFQIQYFGDDWLFIDKYFFNVDGVTKTIDPSYGDIEKDNDSKVWEWFDTDPNKDEIELIRSIIKSKKTVMRIIGSQYYKDVVITSTQKKALKRVLIVYEGLGGKY